MNLNNNAILSETYINNNKPNTAKKEDYLEPFTKFFSDEYFIISKPFKMRRFFSLKRFVRVPNTKNL